MIFLLYWMAFCFQPAINSLYANAQNAAVFLCLSESRVHGRLCACLVCAPAEVQSRGWDPYPRSAGTGVHGWLRYSHEDDIPTHALLALACMADSGTVTRIRPLPTLCWHWHAWQNRGWLQEFICMILIKSLVFETFRLPRIKIHLCLISGFRSSRLKITVIRRDCQ